MIAPTRPPPSRWIDMKLSVDSSSPPLSVVVCSSFFPHPLLENTLKNNYNLQTKLALNIDRMELIHLFLFFPPPSSILPPSIFFDG
jgi:hypothetical protein